MIVLELDGELELVPKLEVGLEDEHLVKEDKLSNLQLNLWNFKLTFSSESIFIGDITNFNKLSVGCSIAVTALHNLSFALSTRILQVTLLICPDSIRSFVTVVRNGRLCHDTAQKLLN